MCEGVCVCMHLYAPQCNHNHSYSALLQEKQDFLLAQQMSQGGNPNDLGSTPINDLNS